MTPLKIRLATAADIPRLQEVEHDAGQMFRSVGYAELCDSGDTFDSEELEEGIADQMLWVAVDGDDVAHAFALVVLVDGLVHLEEIDVHRAHAHQGIGRALIEHIVQWAKGRRLPAITLTTFREVPWNAPYYARLGFRALTPQELTPGLVEVVAWEAANGLDPQARVVMRLDLAV